MTFSSIWARSDHTVIEGRVLLSTLAMHSLHISLHGRLPIYYLLIYYLFFIIYCYFIYYYVHFLLSTLVMHSLHLSLSLSLSLSSARFLSHNFVASPSANYGLLLFSPGGACMREYVCARVCLRCARAHACTRDENFCLYFKWAGVQDTGADTRVHSMPSRPPFTHAQHNTQHTTHKTQIHNTLHTHTHERTCQRQTHTMELLCVLVHTHRVWTHGGRARSGTWQAFSLFSCRPQFSLPSESAHSL